MNRSREQLDRVIFEEIARRRASGERGVDILSLLLDAEDEDGARLSDQELRDQVMTLLFAGHDTATSTVTFLFYELARNPTRWATRRGGGASEDLIGGSRGSTWRSTRRCGCTRPPGSARAASIEPFELHGIHVPGGVFVNYCSWASHHLPEVFPEPERFRPDALRARRQGGAAQGRLRAVRRRARAPASGCASGSWR